MAKVTISVGFDNHPDLYAYVISKGNKGEFIRNCISEIKKQEELRREDEGLEVKIERIMRKCLQEYSYVTNGKNEENEASNDLKTAASFFDED